MVFGANGIHWRRDRPFDDGHIQKEGRSEGGGAIAPRGSFNELERGEGSAVNKRKSGRGAARFLLGTTSCALWMHPIVHSDIR